LNGWRRWVKEKSYKQPKKGRDGMGVNTSGGHPAMDYAEHERTYKAFLGWTKFTVVSVVIILAGMYFFLT
jgi:hypothetical protein